jgi:hypothetical protein
MIGQMPRLQLKPPSQQSVAAGGRQRLLPLPTATTWPSSLPRRKGLQTRSLHQMSGLQQKPSSQHSTAPGGCLQLVPSPADSVAERAPQPLGRTAASQTLTSHHERRLVPEGLPTVFPSKSERVRQANLPSLALPGRTKGADNCLHLVTTTGSNACHSSSQPPPQQAARRRRPGGCGRRGISAAPGGPQAAARRGCGGCGTPPVSGGGFTATAVCL